MFPYPHQLPWCMPPGFWHCCCLPRNEPLRKWYFTFPSCSQSPTVWCYSLQSSRSKRFVCDVMDTVSLFIGFSPEKKIESQDSNHNPV